MGSLPHSPITPYLTQSPRSSHHSAYCSGTSVCHLGVFVGSIEGDCGAGVGSRILAFYFAFPV